MWPFNNMLAQKPKAKPEEAIVVKHRLDYLESVEPCTKTLIATLRRRVQRDLEAHGIDAKAWESGIDSEIRFWWKSVSKNIYSKNRVGYLQQFQVDTEFPFQADIAHIKSETIDALDIGCAIRPTVGLRLTDGRSMKMTAADPLASAYEVLLDLYEIERPYALRFAVGEKLTQIFGVNQYDFVLARNCLDHGFAPHTSMEEIVKTLKPGGVAKLIHFENEAEAEHYKGFHQWNLTKHSDTAIRCWNKTDAHVVEFSGLGTEAKVDSTPFDRGGRFGVMNMITATVRKP
ncbi:methyltransferase domain-containing protein [Rhizobium mongolense]